MSDSTQSNPLVSQSDRAEIGTQAYSLLCVLCTHMNSHREARVSLEKLAEGIDRSTETARKALDILVAQGIVTVKREGRRNVYLLLVAC
jgi:predicted transcriptional regulator